MKGGYWSDLRRADTQLRVSARRAQAELAEANDRFHARGGCCLDCAEPDVTERARAVASEFRDTFGYWPW